MSTALRPVIAIANPSPLGLAEPTADGQAFDLPSQITWMPAGTRTISAGSLDEDGFVGAVTADEQAAKSVDASFTRLRATGQRVWLDANHDDGAAIADVGGFSWDPARGIVADVRWTDYGRRIMAERRFTSFSPSFVIARETGRVTGLIPGHAAGGVVNAPAFGSAMPAIIARLRGLPGDSDASGVNHSQPNKHASMSASTETTDHAAVIARLEKEKSDAQAAAVQARKALIETQVQAAIARGAITEAEKAGWMDTILARAESAELLAKLPGKPAAGVVESETAIKAKAAAGSAEIVSEDVRTVLAAYSKGDKKVQAAIWHKDLKKSVLAPNFGAVLAATNTLGGLAGNLVLQRALTLLKLRFPLLDLISTDFSDEGANFNQQVITRTRGTFTAGDYNAVTGYASNDSTTADVPVTIDQHKFVQIDFNVNELSSTSRDLFAEQAEGAQYAIGKALVDALYARITAGNFANATTQAVGGFNRATLVRVSKALNGRGVSDMGRFLLLNQDYFEALANDTTILQLGTFQRADLINEYRLPRVHGFDPYEAVNLPTTGNLTGFAGTPDSLVVATRVPADYSAALPGAGNGSVSTVTNPDTGVSVQLVQYVDHKLGSAFWRAAFMFGTARGQAASGQRIISA